MEGNVKEFEKLIELARHYNRHGKWRAARKICEALHRNAPEEMRDRVAMFAREMPFKIRMDDKTLDMF
jgi:hypothetical protein